MKAWQSLKGGQEVTGLVNVVDVTYAQTGASVNTDALGMWRCSSGCSPSGMLSICWIKAPPASGKLRGR